MEKVAQRVWKYAVRPEWAQQAIKHGPGIQFIDASWHMPNSGRHAKKEFELERLPGAVYFDIDECCDLETTLPHMMPSREVLKSYLENLGVSGDKPIVVYDCSDMGMFSSPRLWWMLLSAGVDQVAVLEGGMKQWKALDFEVEKITPPPQKPRTTLEMPELNKSAFISADEVLGIIDQIEGKPIALIDARSVGRFNGVDPEPRPGLRKGHIPGSVNIPFMTTLNSNGYFKDNSEIEQIFASVGVSSKEVQDEKFKFAFTCGSGMTACVSLLALVDSLNVPKERCTVYDGSFSEWGVESGPLPVAQGPAEPRK